MVSEERTERAKRCVSMQMTQPIGTLIDLSTPDEGNIIHTNVELNERMGQTTS